MGREASELLTSRRSFQMKYWLQLSIILAAIAILPATSYVMAGEEKKESGEKPFYVGAFGGYSFPVDATNVEGRGAVDGVSFSDIGLKQGWSGGLKFGWKVPGSYYGNERNNGFNWEFEYWYQNIHSKQQDVTATIPGVGSAQVSLSGANGHVHIFASNWILRRPTGMIQPYAGVGPSLVMANFSGSQSTSTSLGIGDESAIAFGLNMLVGTRVMFSKSLGVFAEFKHNRAFNLEFDTAQFDLNTTAVVGGLTLDFESISIP